MSMSEYYFAIQGALNQLEVYQPLVTDLKILRQYRQDFVVVKFLSSLYSSLPTQMRDQIFTGDRVLSLTTYSRVFRIFIGSTM